MKTIKFKSTKYLTNYTEETEEGLLITYPKYEYDVKEIEATILGENKTGTRFKLKLPDGNIIYKRKKDLQF